MKTWIAAIVLAVFSVPARADEDVELRQLSVGGGVAGFIGDAGNQTLVGGAWDVRLRLRSRWLPIDTEFAYVGSANGLSDRTAALAPQGIIVGNGVEANVILNLAPRGGRVDPYLFAGIGFTRFSLVHENTYDRMWLRNGDSALVFPAGAGASVRLTDALLLDARLTFRTVFDDGMMYLSLTPGASALNMSQWAASARLVFEF